MSAERLREAAALMRERAEAATPGPWAYAPYGIGSDVMWDIDAADVNVGATNGEVDADHLASWHPAVALAVAEWLDLAARRMQSVIDDARAYGEQVRDLTGDFGPALAVADAYLSGTP